MENALGVQVSHTAGNITGQLHPGEPAQMIVALQKLLQVSAINVLKTWKHTSDDLHKIK